MGLIDALGGRRVYLDANIFIYAVEGAERFAMELPPFFRSVARAELQAVTSLLTLAEVLVKPLTDGSEDRRHAYERVLVSTGGLTVAPVTREVIVEAAQLRAHSRLKLADAIHAATARLHGCEALLTNDAGLREAPGIEVVLLAEAAGG